MTSRPYVVYYVFHESAFPRSRLASDPIQAAIVALKPSLKFVLMFRFRSGGAIYPFERFAIRLGYSAFTNGDCRKLQVVEKLIKDAIGDIRF